MLIEQIDTLSHIADEFSSFAKMPKAKIEKQCLNDLVKSAIELFKESAEIELLFNDNTISPIYILVDKEQSLRVFTNLLKNALQAIPEGRAGKIEVTLHTKAKNVIVKIKDNGTGIAPEVMDKIFVPNFSTKSEGMGLGLAMVKNIVESFEGKIWFDTAQGLGTSFYVSFNIIEEKSV
jgi:signal transduction histidine kinase